MDETEWRLMMERRVQLPNEPTTDYIIHKNALFRKRPTPTAEADRIDFLIRGLPETGLKFAALSIPTNTVDAFVELIQRKEQTLKNPFSTGVMALLSDVPTLAPKADPLAAIQEQLRQSQKEAQKRDQLIQQQQRDLQALQRQLANNTRPATYHGTSGYAAPKQERYSPAQALNGPPPVATGANAAPVQTRNQQSPGRPRPGDAATVTNTSFTDPTRQSSMQNNACYRCGQQGHIARQCDVPSRPSGNGPAGSQGQPNQLNQ
jgi:hypothetical protein